MFAKTRQYLVADVTDIFLGAILGNVARLVALVTPVSKIFIVLATQSILQCKSGNIDHCQQQIHIINKISFTIDHYWQQKLK